MSARQPSPGAQLGRRALSNGNQYAVPSNSILVPREPPLERGRVADTLSNVILAIIASIAIFGWVFIVLFVRV